MRYDDRTALITGASSGIGAEFARRLAYRGADLVLVARRAKTLERLAQEIRSSTGRRVHVFPRDLSADGAGHRLVNELARVGVTIDTVINCAGTGTTGPVEDSTEEEMQRQLSVNIHAVVAVSHAALPQLIASKRGVLVNVASLTAYMPVPGMAVYAASKSFILRFTEALAYETQRSGVTVMALSPGPTATEFYSTSGTTSSGVHFQTPADVVTTALRALGRRSPPISVVSGARNRWVRRLVALLPRRTVLRLAEVRPSV